MTSSHRVAEMNQINCLRIISWPNQEMPNHTIIVRNTKRESMFGLIKYRDQFSSILLS